MENLLVKVKSRLFIHANRRALSLLDGEYGSLSRGRSLDFDDLREYVPGDEVKDIDWKATARSGHPLVKRYIDTRRQDVLLVVDTGHGMSAIADSGEPKRELAVLVAGVLGYLSIRHGDVVGLVTGDAEGHRGRRPGGREADLESTLRQIDAESRATRAPSALGPLLDRVLRTVRRRQIVVIIADEITLDEPLRELARRLAARHELLWVTLADADLLRGDGSEHELVAVGARGTLPRALRSGRRLVAAYQASVAARRQEQHDFFDQLGVSHQYVGSVETVVPALLALLRRRRARLR